MPPVISCPANYNGCSNENPIPAVTGFATAVPGTLGCPRPKISFTDLSIIGTCPKIITRRWIAFDTINNLSDTCEQTITLNDTEAPIINVCVSDTTINCLSNLPAPFSFNQLYSNLGYVKNCLTPTPTTFVLGNAPGNLMNTGITTNLVDSGMLVNNFMKPMVRWVLVV